MLDTHVADSGFLECFSHTQLNEAVAAKLKAAKPGVVVDIVVPATRETPSRARPFLPSPVSPHTSAFAHCRYSHVTPQSSAVFAPAASIQNKR